MPVAIAAVLLLGAGVVLGAALYGGGEPERGGPSPVDVGFARDMIVHHQQAVDMAAIAGPRLRGQAAALAEQIRASQQREIGQLQGWLTAWGKPVAGGEPMTWMTHDSNHGERGGHGAGDRPPMPGMASMPELQRLGELTGTALQSRFCQLMLRHHHGGVAMAEGAAERAARPYVRA
ncbi:MAG: DUF305 domain-containing protein, partial [Thermocrispum sp.]